MSLIEQYYKRTCAGFWPYVINTEEDDDEDVLDGSQWHQTINIRPWQENVIGTNDAYFHTVAWYRAWGKIADVNELAACATRWKVPVPCSNVLWNLLLNESAEDILVMLCPPTRVRNTLPTRRSSRAHAWASVRRHWLDELSTTDRLGTTRHGWHVWQDWHAWLCTVRITHLLQQLVQLVLTKGGTFTSKWVFLGCIEADPSDRRLNFTCFSCLTW